jgi:integrase family protein with SAM-like domain
VATTTPSAALVPVAPVFTNTERLALAGFLAACRGLTRQAYELDLRQFAGWCQQHQLRLFQARCADIEFFGRDLEARGRARATITRRLCTVAGFCRYAAGEELLDHSPAAQFAGLAWTTNPAPRDWAATSPARCWPPGPARRRNTR